MSKSTDLPKNKLGGLNLNWAITQALAQFGPKAKIGEVRTFIINSYGKLGEKAVENDGSLSTALSSARKKMLDEGTKVPAANLKAAPVPTKVPAANLKATPVPTNGPAKLAPEIATPAPLSVIEQFRIYINSTVVPAQRSVQGGVSVAGSLLALKQAIAVVEDAQAKLGDNYEGVVKAFAG